jgi:hypothetical protein
MYLSKANSWQPVLRARPQISILVVKAVRNPLTSIKYRVCLPLFMPPYYLVTMDLGSSPDSAIVAVTKEVSADTIFVTNR